MSDPRPILVCCQDELLSGPWENFRKVAWKDLEDLWKLHPHLQSAPPIHKLGIVQIFFGWVIWGGERHHSGRGDVGDPALLPGRQEGRQVQALLQALQTLLGVDLPPVEGGEALLQELGFSMVTPLPGAGTGHLRLQVRHCGIDSEKDKHIILILDASSSDST